MYPGAVPLGSVLLTSQRSNSTLVPKAGQTGPLDSLDYAKLSSQSAEQEQRWESGFRSGQVRYMLSFPFCILESSLVAHDPADIWRTQVRSVNARDAASLMMAGWVLLDVRPPTEAKKARVIGAVEVSLYHSAAHMALALQPHAQRQRPLLPAFLHASAPYRRTGNTWGQL